MLDETTLPELLTSVHVKTEPLELFTSENMGILVEAIKKKAVIENPDLTTAKGRQEFASMANNVARSKTFLAAIGKEITAGWKKKSKDVDAVSKSMRDAMDELKVEVRKPLTDWEEEEKERVKVAGGCLQDITNARTVEAGTTSAAIMGKITTIDGYNYPDTLSEEALETLQEEQEITLSTLRNLHDQAVKSEEDQAELDNLRKEKEERDEKDRKEKEERETKEKAEAEEKERLESEKKAEEEKKATEERVRKETEERLKKEAAEKSARKERERQADAQREREEEEAAEKEAAEKEEKRKNNTLRRKNVQAAAVASLSKVCEIDPLTAKAIVCAIDESLIENITINY